MKFVQNEEKSKMEFRAYNSKAVDKNRAKCNMGFGRISPKGWTKKTQNVIWGFLTLSRKNCSKQLKNKVGQKSGKMQYGVRAKNKNLPNVGGVLKRRGLKCARLEFSGCQLMDYDQQQRM